MIRCLFCVCRQSISGGGLRHLSITSSLFAAESDSSAAAEPKVPRVPRLLQFGELKPFIGLSSEVQTSAVRIRSLDFDKLSGRLAGLSDTEWRSLLAGLAQPGHHFPKNLPSVMKRVRDSACAWLEKNVDRIAPIDFFNFLRFLSHYYDAYKDPPMSAELRELLAQWFLQNCSTLVPDAFFEIFYQLTDLESTEPLLQLKELSVAMQRAVEMAENADIVYILRLLDSIDHFSMQYKSNEFEAAASKLIEVLRARKSPKDLLDLGRSVLWLAKLDRKTIKYNQSDAGILRLPVGVDFDPAWNWLRYAIDLIFDDKELDHRRSSAALVAIRAYLSKAVDFSAAEIEGFLQTAAAPYLSDPSLVFQRHFYTSHKVSFTSLLVALRTAANSDLSNKLNVRLDNVFWDKFYSSMNSERQKNWNAVDRLMRDISMVKNKLQPHEAKLLTARSDSNLSTAQVGRRSDINETLIAESNVDKWRELLRRSSSSGARFIGSDAKDSVCDWVAKNSDRMTPFDFSDFLQFLAKYFTTNKTESMSAELRTLIAQWFLKNSASLSPFDFYGTFQRLAFLSQSLKLNEPFLKKQEISVIINRAVELATGAFIFDVVRTLENIDHFSKYFKPEECVEFELASARLIEVLRTRAKPEDKADLRNLIKHLAYCDWTTISYNGFEKPVLLQPFGVDFDPAWNWLRNTIDSIFNDDAPDIFQRCRAALVAVRAYQTKAVDFSAVQIDGFLQAAAAPFLADPSLVVQRRSDTDHQTSFISLLVAIRTAANTDLEEHLCWSIRLNDVFWDKLYSAIEECQQPDVNRLSRELLTVKNKLQPQEAKFLAARSDKNLPAAHGKSSFLEKAKLMAARSDKNLSVTHIKSRSRMDNYEPLSTESNVEQFRKLLRSNSSGSGTKASVKDSLCDWVSNNSDRMTPVDFSKFLRFLREYYFASKESISSNLKTLISQWILNNCATLSSIDFFEIFQRLKFLSRSLQSPEPILQLDDLSVVIERAVELAPSVNIFEVVRTLEHIDHFSKQYKSEDCSVFESAATRLIEVLRTRAKPEDKDELLHLVRNLAVYDWRTISYTGYEAAVLSRPDGVEFDPAWNWLRNTIESVFNEHDELWKVLQRPKAALIAVRAYQTKAIDFSPAQIDRFLQAAAAPFLTNPSLALQKNTENQMQFIYLLAALRTAANTDLAKHLSVRLDDAFWDQLLLSLRRARRRPETTVQANELLEILRFVTNKLRPHEAEFLVSPSDSKLRWKSAQEKRKLYIFQQPLPS